MTKMTWKGMAGSTAILLIFCACFMVGVGLAAADPSVSVDPQTNEYDAGDTFQVTVMVNSDTANLRAVNLQLDYDPAILSVNSITNENLLGAGALVAPGSGDDGAGTITYGIASTSGVYTPVNGTMLTIEFAIDVSAANGTYNLDLNSVSLKDQDNVAIPGVIITDGTVKVGEEVTPPTPSEPEVEISPVASGPVGPGDTFQIQVEVDSADNNLRAVNLQLDYDSSALMVNSITDENLLGAGALVAPGSGDDGAGTITYGIASTSGVYTPEVGTMLTIEFEVKAGAANGTYDLDLNNVILKDETNTAIPGVGVTDGTVQVAGGQAPDVPTVMVVPASSGPLDIGETFMVDVEVDSADYNLRAVSVQLDYDPAALMVNSMTNDLLGPGALEAPGSGDDGAGTITYGLAATGGVYTPEAGTLLTIEFEVKENATDGIYDLDLYNVILRDQDNADIPGVVVTDGTVEVATVPEVPVPEGIELLPGWSLISVPEKLENGSIDYVLQDFNDTEIDMVFYDNVSSGMMEVPDEFEPLKAYWVHNNLTETVVINETYLTPMVPSTPPSLTVYPGWNAIGHTAMVELPAEVALSTIDDCYVKVTGPWLPSTSEFAYVGYNGQEGVINGNQVGTDVFAMNMYEGYYVFVDKECVLA